MVDNESIIRNIEAARADLEVAKVQLENARAAGLTDVVKALEPDIIALEVQVSNLEAVYGILE